MPVRIDRMWRAFGRRAAAVLVLLLCNACDDQEDDEIAVPVRVSYNPYAEVDWALDLRLKAQHHDHVGNRPEMILAYDRAGYDVVSLMDYSGNPAMSYSWTERIWPPERFVPKWVMDSLVNVKLFVPNAEEIGIRAHLTSPFLTTYIEGGSDQAPWKVEWQYSSMEEAFDVIRNYDGIPCIAHPWTVSYTTIKGTFCVEIYTAFAAAGSTYLKVPWFQGRDPDELVKAWDYALQYNQRIWGIAVNDHFGPQHRGSLPDDIIDSGKILVLAKEATLRAYRDAFERGAFFAIEDRGAIKDQYPQVFSIRTDGYSSIIIDSSGAVVWKSHGQIVGEGPVLDLQTLPHKARFVRAEIRSESGVVYTQPFSLRPVVALSE